MGAWLQPSLGVASSTIPIIIKSIENATADGVCGEKLCIFSFVLTRLVAFIKKSLGKYKSLNERFNNIYCPISSMAMPFVRWLG